MIWTYKPISEVHTWWVGPVYFPVTHSPQASSKNVRKTGLLYTEWSDSEFSLLIFMVPTKDNTFVSFVRGTLKMGQFLHYGWGDVNHIGKYCSMANPVLRKSKNFESTHVSDVESNAMWSSKMSSNSQILIWRYSQMMQIISLFPGVFANLRLPISLEPIDRFQWDLL